MLNTHQNEYTRTLPDDLHTGATDVTFDEQGKQLVLVKNGQRYVFRYEQGEEATVLQHLVLTVQDEQSELDWFDAALISHEMGQRLCSQLKQILKPTGTDPWTP